MGNLEVGGGEREFRGKNGGMVEGGREGIKTFEHPMVSFFSHTGEFKRDSRSFERVLKMQHPTVFKFVLNILCWVRTDRKQELI